MPHMYACVHTHPVNLSLHSIALFVLAHPQTQSLIWHSLGSPDNQKLGGVLLLSLG